MLDFPIQFRPFPLVVSQKTNCNSAKGEMGIAHFEFPRFSAKR
jgi:hypothetical protein